MGLQQTDFIAYGGDRTNMLAFHLYHLYPGLTPEQVIDKFRAMAAEWAANMEENPEMEGAFDWCDVANHCEDISDYMSGTGLVLIEVDNPAANVWKYEVIYRRDASDG